MWKEENQMKQGSRLLCYWRIIPVEVCLVYWSNSWNGCLPQKILLAVCVRKFHAVISE